MNDKDKDRYAIGLIGFEDRVEYKTAITNWIPPRYAVIKYVNGATSQIMVDGVSLKAAHGYIKLLKEE